MSTALIALASFVGFIVAYHTYGRWLSRKIFKLDPQAPVPSRQLRDDIDFVPSKKEIVFGHHFTSIAGTGPIVGPAIAVFWGWLPALLWVLIGSIFIGAVHDLGSLVVSLRNRGQTVGEIAGRVINPRARILFLIVLFFALTIVIAIFGLVIAVIFAEYPESVLSIWIEIPLAVAIGFWVYKRNGSLLIPSLIALAVMYAMMWIGAYLLPIDLSTIFGIPLTGNSFPTAVQIWTFILLIYCFFASVLPVWSLMQPRDYINSHELVLAMALLILGLFVASFTHPEADLVSLVPAISSSIPADAPPIWPFLFITIACGACSGFHCLVSSGTSSKQLSSETHAQSVGYGAMLLEGALAVLVILACCSGVAMGNAEKRTVPTSTALSGYIYSPATDPVTGSPVTGREAWLDRYSASTHTWASFNLSQCVGAFINGGANFLSTLGIPIKLGITIIAVLVTSFAATTLDTSTRLQRYVIEELSHAVRFKPTTNKYAATALALVTGGAVAMFPGPRGPGSGGFILWPLFGATNQLLAGLALLVIAFYLWRRRAPIAFIILPLVLMLIIPGWAMGYNILYQWAPWLTDEAGKSSGKPILFTFGLIILVLQFWLILEALLMWPKVKGILEHTHPSPTPQPAPVAADP